MFTATRLQIATYLLGVCPFSIAFLVFLNSSVSFVITDLIGSDKEVGDAVGNLGFGDELVALIACPLWGLLSDRFGVRWVCVGGYLIICVALILFVQSHNVYPQLLLGRLFFSIGGAAASTMVTAVLPAMSYSSPEDSKAAANSAAGAAGNNGHIASPSIASELTITPARYRSTSRGRSPMPDRQVKAQDQFKATNRVAGFVGMFTGCGALIALLIFLPLPARFQKNGVRPEVALQYSYYIVAALAFILAVWCFIGLRNLHSEQERNAELKLITATEDREAGITKNLRSARDNFQMAVMAGFQRSDIAMGYLGGFVARASSVGISLFVPLLVNAMFLSSGFCDVTETPHTPTGLPDIKRRCPRAYIVAAELTGVSQMVALIAAPVFGYVSGRSSRRGLPLMFAAVAGIIGYPLFATRFDPDDTNKGDRAVAFFAVCLIGISQIGAIVCSLGTLSAGVLAASPSADDKDTARTSTTATDPTDEEHATLLGNAPSRKTTPTLAQLKGSVAGVYSFYGGAAILILTKAGGALFDSVSVGAPFYIMAGFNVILLIACAALGLKKTITTSAT